MRWWRRRSHNDELTRISVLVAGDHGLGAELTAAAAAHPACRTLAGICTESGLVSAILRRRPDYALLCAPAGDQPELVARAVRTAANPPTTRIVVFERIGTQVVHEPVELLHDDELHLLDELAAPLCHQHIA
jgi:hypothetical protein